MIYRRTIFGLLIAIFAASILFYRLPQIDLVTSGLFQTSGSFWLEKGKPGALITDILHYGMRAAFFGYMAIGGLLLAIHRAPDWLTPRRYVFIVLSVAIAAGLVTNVALKDHWGRARPNQIVAFGGDRQFTPAWVISDQCRKNCSFVGGDVSFAFCALAPALSATRRRLLWISSAIGFGSLIALSRIAAGGHFLSDCILAALLTSLVVVGLARLLAINEQ